MASRLDLVRRHRADDRLDATLTGFDPIQIQAGEATVVADGLWFNPNHFFRLRLFVEALVRKGERFRLLGLLRSRNDHRARRALQRIGFSEFVYIDEDAEFRTDGFLDEADRLLRGVRTHDELLQLQLPEDVPAYVWYDTVLKLSSHPRPDLQNPVWRTALAEALRDIAIYRRELSVRKISHVALSHPWKTEWATLVWLALGRSVPVYHLTGFCEGIRIRRFRTQQDYATPVEHLGRGQFETLPPRTKELLSECGRRDLARRISGTSTDINARYAYNASRRIAEREAARMALSGQTGKPVAIVYSHVWYDFPHTYAMRNFSDFLDWMSATLDHIRNETDVIWLLKPHPTERWYGGFYLSDIAKNLPPHVRLLPIDVDNETALLAADAVVTVHGTVGLEAAARGLPVVLADRSYFSDWEIAHVARSRPDYFRLLSGIRDLAAPDNAARARAYACFALALAEPPAEGGALRMSCDSTGLPLYPEIERRLKDDRPGLEKEALRIMDFLNQDEFDSFAAFHLVENAQRRIVANAA
ncbi:MAG: hypothetical protein AB7K04_11890 [Pseudorhodoplanes sp.]